MTNPHDHAIDESVRELLEPFVGFQAAPLFDWIEEEEDDARDQ